MTNNIETIQIPEFPLDIDNDDLDRIVNTFNRNIDRLAPKNPSLFYVTYPSFEGVKGILDCLRDANNRTLPRLAKELRIDLYLMYRVKPSYTCRQLEGAINDNFSYISRCLKQSPQPQQRKPTVYIAGPMRGIPYFNFDAFDKAKYYLQCQGYEVISPADMDREVGFDPFQHAVNCDWSNPGGFDDLSFPQAVRRDIEAVTRCDEIYLLDGWEESQGANVEKAVAEWLGLTIRYQTPPQEPSQDETILDTAKRLTSVDRQSDYGSPADDFARIAKMWSALKGVEFSGQEVAMFLICVKLSRQSNRDKLDNWIDLAGYARCGSQCSSKTTIGD